MLSKSEVEATLREMRKSVRPKLRYQKGSVWAAGTRVKTWKGSYRIDTVVDGRPKRIKKFVVLGLRSEMSKTEAKAKLWELLKQEMGDNTAPKTTVEDCWKRYVSTMQRGTSDSQKLVIAGCWKKIAPRWAKVDPNTIDRQELQEWFDGLTGIGESYLKKILTYFRAALQLAKEDELIRRNAATSLQLPEVESKAKQLYTIEQLAKLIQASHGRERVIIRLAIECGLRPGELFALRWSDWMGDSLMIDESYSKSKVRKTKTEASKAKVSVPKQLQTELQFYRASLGNPAAEAWMFPSPLTDRPIDLSSYRKDYLKPLGKRVGLPDIDFRVLRRSCATYLNEIGGAKAAQGQLRHADPDMTLRVYVQVVPEEVQRAAAEFEARLNSQMQDEKQATNYTPNESPEGVIC